MTEARIRVARRSRPSAVAPAHTLSSHAGDQDGTPPAASPPTSSAGFLGTGTGAIVDAMPVGLFVEDTQGRSWMNAELARMWRFDSPVAPSGAVLQRDLMSVTRQSDPASSVRAVFERAVRRARWQRRLLRRRDGTSVPVRVRRTTIAGSNGVALDATWVLETRHRQTEARLREAFLATVGHELRSPIASIVAGADLLKDRGLDPTTRDEVTGLVVAEANRIHLLVEQLAALTLLQSSDSTVASEPVHLVRLAREVAAREALRRPRIHVRPPQLGNQGGIALGDEGLVAQVLTALIDNAAKFTEAGGEVEITVAEMEHEIAVHVLDRGPGLRGADVARLFELFQRGPTDAADKRGTGVGLFVARRLMAAMHGRIWAVDRPGGGAAFGIALPVAHDVADSEGRSRHPGRPAGE